MSFLRLLSLALCISLGTSLATEKQPLVLVSVAAYQDIVQEMAGTDVDVRTVVPTGMNFHSYEPTPGHVISLSTAKLWLTIGASFEKKILAAMESTGSPPVVVDLRTGLPLLHDSRCMSCQEANDTHIWTSPRMMKTQITTIQNALISAFPAKKVGIEERYTTLQQRIDELIKMTDEKLGPEKGKIIVIAHGAYDHLCHDYGIEQRAIESGGKEATARTLLGIIQEAKSKRVKTVFSLKQYPKKGIERIAEELQAKIVELDAYQPNYFASMLSTVDALNTALNEEIQ